MIILLIFIKNDFFIIKIAREAQGQFHEFRNPSSYNVKSKLEGLVCKYSKPQGLVIYFEFLSFFNGSC